MRVQVTYGAWERPGCVWTYGDHEHAIPNASVWRNPWGVYVRTRRYRVAFGPRFRRQFCRLK